MLYKPTLFLLSQGPQEASLMSECLFRKSLATNYRQTNQQRLNRDLVVMKLIASPEVGSSGVYWGSCEAIRDQVFHPSVEPCRVQALLTP